MKTSAPVSGRRAIQRVVAADRPAGPGPTIRPSRGTAVIDRPEDHPAGESHSFEPTVEPKPARPGKKRRAPEGTLASALIAYAALNGLAGVLLLVIPRFVWVTVGRIPSIGGVHLDSTRFAGGALVALAIGALLVLRKPKGQHTLVTVLALEATLVAIGLLMNIFIDDVTTSDLFNWVMAIISAALTVYLWWARIKARKVLKAG